MNNTTSVPIDEKIKLLTIEQQNYIKGLVDGALLNKPTSNLQPTG